MTDKWISASPGQGQLFFNILGNGIDNKCGGFNAGEKGVLAAHFQYVNRVMGDIGNDAVIDITKLNQLKDNIKITLYQYISDLLTENEYMFYPLPAYINLAAKGLQENDLLDMFRPSLNFEKVSCGPLFLSMYVGGNSRQLSFKAASNCSADITPNFDNDSFNLSIEGIEKPDEFLGTSTNNSTPGFTAFKVVYGLENQNHFKNIQLDQTEFSETAESLLVVDKLAQQGGTDQSTKGQNLNSVYLTRSYTCTMESLGNMMIQPMMYFDLFGVPMFNGAYLITEVKHNFKPNHATTTFKGTRQPIATIPIVTDAAVAMTLTLKDIKASTNAGSITTNSNLKSIGKQNPPIDSSILKLFTNPFTCDKKAKVTSQYAVRQIDKGAGSLSENHCGLDISPGNANEYYTDGPNKGKGKSVEVVSVYNGVVTDARAMSGFGAPPDGGAVVIRYGEDNGSKPFSDNYFYFFVYGHVTPKVGLIPGTIVKAGEVIGNAVWPNRDANGEKLFNTGLHLHLQVHRQTENQKNWISGCANTVNPSSFLNQKENCIGNVQEVIFGTGDDITSKAGNVNVVRYNTVNTTPTETSNYYNTILTKLGAPITDGNILFLKAWRQAEGGNATWNGFNTTLNKQNSTNYNEDKVKNYVDGELGAQAIVDTLLQTPGGRGTYYKNIVDTLRKGIKDQNDAKEYAKNWQLKGGDLFTWVNGPNGPATGEQYEKFKNGYVYNVLKYNVGTGDLKKQA
jgi:hypothetical protein